MGKATTDLRHEHDAILNVFGILDRMLIDEKNSDEVNLAFAGGLTNFLVTFADTCHHGKEENYLFKALEQAGVPNAGGPIGAMLQEHVIGRDYITAMKEAVASSDLAAFKRQVVGYRDLLRAHIFKENNVLFALADHMLDDVSQDGLFEKFEAWEEDVVGQGVHEMLHAQIDKWAKQYPA